ncbi:aspartyl protease family protein [Tenacibaculum maritimum]|uniref:aspartyl protease family protein n=1 Tax=Tenacibaculum maritimum TaxID=107401 RepID=UPI00352B4E81
MKKYILLFIILLFCSKIKGQSGFYFSGDKKNKQSIRFKLINNLIVIPLEINGKPLSFILDTGVNKTILFNLSKKDSLDLRNARRIILRGLGSGAPVEALVSKGNQFKIKNLISEKEELCVILEDKFDISAKMGVTIHGIIGYSLFKNLIVNINYRTKKIAFYNPNTFDYPKCKRCEVFSLEFYKNKPYINTEIQLDTIENKKIAVKMLIDTGGSDALWLFEGSKKEIKTPKKYFNDFIGEGLSGTIYGHRARIPIAKLGSYEIKAPTVTFLDSISTFNARKFKERNGSFGGGALKRFKIWIDYSNKKITFKKNGSLSKGFFYNMSGLGIVYNGQELVQEEVKDQIIQMANGGSRNKGSFSFVTSYRYNFKPSYKVERVIKGSPGDLSGIKEGDEIKMINGRFSHEYNTLEEIISLFRTKPNKRIRMVVNRNGLKLKFEFRLRRRI